LTFVLCYDRALDMIRIFIVWICIITTFYYAIDWCYGLSQTYAEPNPNRAIIVVPKS
jgi:hypothetical protein